MPTPQYLEILNELAQGSNLTDLENRVLSVLRRAYPASVSRQRLCVEVCGGMEPADISRDVRDRKVRKGIEGLRDAGFPIVSSSGEAGYSLNASVTALETMAAEYRSRNARNNDRIRNIERLIPIVKRAGVAAIPHEVAKSATQPTLFGR